MSSSRAQVVALFVLCCSCGTCALIGAGRSSGGGAIGTLAVVGLVLLACAGLAGHNLLRGRKERAKAFWPNDAAEAELAEAPPEEPIARTAIRITELEATLRARDPEFTVTGFLDQARAAAQEIVKARGAGEPGLVRCRLVDGLFCSYETQRALRRRNRTRRVAREPRVEAVALEAAASDEHFDALEISVRVSGVELDVPLETTPAEAERLLDVAPRASRNERWTWLRCAGARTRSVGAAGGLRCPGCGTGLPGGGAIVRCDHCGVLVNTGEHSWIVTAIVPRELPRPVAEPKLRGWRRLAAKDPRASVQQIEDRAAFLVFKWIESRIAGEAGVLTRFATPELLRGVQSRLDQGVLGLPLERLETPAIVAATLVAVDAVEDGRPDLAYVKVTWSLERNGVVRGAPTALAMLSRDESARSAVGVTTFRCAGCGGPLAATDSLRCEYCGAAIEPGRTEWILAAVEPESKRIEFRARRKPEATADGRRRRSATRARRRRTRPTPGDAR
jgi:hypothetical protein